MIPLLIDGAFRVSIVMGIALAAAALLRRHSAAFRHWILAAAIVCSLLLPAFQVFVPQWPVAPGMSWPLTASDPGSPLQPGVVVAETTSVRQQPGVTGTWSAGAIIGGIWFAGTAIALTIVLIGLGRLAWLASGSTEIRNGRWHELSQEMARDSRLRRRLRLLQSDHPSLLVTWGVLHPRILLPATANEWPEERVRVVLSHELAHIERRDWASQMTAELLRAFHWFNPLVWLLCRRLREESERACDDAVLNAGVEGPAYATHLLELARSFSAHRAPWSPAPAIAHSSHFERRVRAMLNPGLDRRPISTFARIAIVLAVIGISLPIAALAQTAFSTFSGSVLDPMDALMADARMILTNSQTNAKYEVRTDRTGRFEFVGLPPADYLLEARVAGFATLHGKVTISGQDLQQDITLQVGTLEETITVTETNDAPRNARPALRKRPLPECNTSPVAGTVGGKIRPPVKIQHVPPNFPPGVQDARVEEIVVLDARIATDGSIKDIDVVPPAHPVFADAAVEAVRQWQFDETLLNCVPVEVAMKVTVTFKARTP